MKPWFLDDLLNAFRGVYFVARGIGQIQSSRERWIGFLLAISGMILSVGGSPLKVLLPEDVQILNEVER